LNGCNHIQIGGGIATSRDAVFLDKVCREKDDGSFGDVSHINCHGVLAADLVVQI
jgi:hypothetical protein